MQSVHIYFIYWLWNFVFFALIEFYMYVFYIDTWTIDLFGSLSLGFVTEATEEELHERFPSRGRACKSKAAPPSKDPKGDKKKDVGKKSNGAQKDSDGP